MSTVIKAGQMGAGLQRLSRVDLADHLREADAVVAAARRRADEMLREAQARITALQEEARQRGHAQGFQEGRAQGLDEGRQSAFREASESFAREQADALGMISDAFRQFEDGKRALLADARRNLLHFAVDVAARLTFAIGAERVEAAAANLERALAKVSSATDVTIRANPRDLDALETFARRHAESWGSGMHVRVVADEAIAPGGCVVAAGTTQIDADLDTQVRQMTAILLGGAADD